MSHKVRPAVPLQRRVLHLRQQYLACSVQFWAKPAQEELHLGDRPLPQHPDVPLVQERDRRGRQPGVEHLCGGVLHLPEKVSVVDDERLHLQCTKFLAGVQPSPRHDVLQVQGQTFFLSVHYCGGGDCGDPFRHVFTDGDGRIKPLFLFFEKVFFVFNLFVKSFTDPSLYKSR